MAWTFPGDRMKQNESKALGCLRLLAFGAVASVLGFFIRVAVACALGTIVWWLLGYDWLFSTAISYVAIGFLMASAEVFYDLRGVRCPKCNRRIKTSRPVKCGECGGAAQLVSPRTL